MLHGNLSVELGRRVVAAAQAALEVRITPTEAAIRPSRHPGVDYQSDVAMGLAAHRGRDPREVAADIVAHLDAADLVQPPRIGGAGFINLVLTPAFLTERASALLAEERLGCPRVETSRRIAIDHSGPDVAKEMHLGHLRSAVVGDAVGRLLRFAGHEVVTHHHIGDWGTPFGMLIEHLVDEGLTTSVAVPSPDDRCFGGLDSLGDLNGLYQQARKKFDVEPDFADRTRRRVVLLRRGHRETRELWRRLVGDSARHVEQVHQLLGIRLTAADACGGSDDNNREGGPRAAIVGEQRRADDDGAFRAHAGGSAELVDLLVEAIDRAATIVEQRAELPEEQWGWVARAVGIGAVKYAVLTHDRRTVGAFDYDRDRMLAMTGNSAAYLQYAHCRIRSLLRRAGAAEAAATGAPVVLVDPRERALLVRILRFPEACAAATRAYAPHKLCTYLYETASAFSSFYAACPVLSAATPELRDSRLTLAALTSRVLALGLSLLGIESPERI